jgi:TrmH family RNA methyltransferase
VTADPITSVRNRRVVEAAALARRRDRRARGRYLVEGPNAVDEVVAEGHAETVFATAALVGAYRGGPVEVVEVTDHVLERLADSRSPQGVVAVARATTSRLADVVGHGCLVVLVDPSDPGNAGTIIRTADAAGAAGVVLAGDAVDPFNPKAVRASTGSVCHLPPVVDVGVDEVLAACRAAGQWVVALDGTGTVDVEVLAQDDRPVAVLLGNEAHGLSDDLLGRVDDVLSVPTYGRAESLNLSAAAAVTLYTAARGRHPTGRDVGPGPRRHGRHPDSHDRSGGR